MTRRLLLAGVLASLLPLGPDAPVHADQTIVLEKGPVTYEVTAALPRLNRKVMGPVRNFVNGVPAEPVNSMVWDGIGSVPVEGSVSMVVDADAEVGVVRASWTDEHGDWTFEQTKFVHPEHWSGVRIGSSVSVVESFINEGVVPNVYLHGDSNAGQPVLPTVFAYLATWGPAEVTLNGHPFANPYEIPAPLWLAHVMVTEGVRQPDGTVRTVNGDIYNPGLKDQGAVETGGDLEVHLVFHDERFPMTSNVPPLFSFFYHLVFEDVKIEITQGELPGAGSGNNSGIRPRTRKSFTQASRP